MNAVSPRTESLAKKLGKDKYRHAYLSQHLRMFLATQIRALRGNYSQVAFGKLIGKPQSVVSRLESAEYGKVSLQTLIEIANKLDIALIVRFVSYPMFVRSTEDFSDAALRPKPFDQSDIDALLRPLQQVAPGKPPPQDRRSNIGSLLDAIKNPNPEEPYERWRSVKGPSIGYARQAAERPPVPQ